ncbi:MAG TPA: heat-inducible transcriptional repressor HrcA [Acidimicrobiia bacterium]|nr:heat-inducible transcriptional repressor HrcA [Acidimicrobiia bacterium]
MLDDRKAAILGALVEEHIRSGEPVSSQAILTRARLDCSSATVRNEMSLLERDGFIVKPHTSAGRIPTEKGYRYYVDHLSPGSLRATTRTRIEDFFSHIHGELSRLLKQTSDFLADISQYPSVVLGPGLVGHTIRDLHLIPVEPGVVLLVVVTDGGRVSQSLIRLSEPATHREIEEAQEALGALLAGTEVSDEAVQLEESVEKELPSIAVEVAERALVRVGEFSRASREIYLGGTSHMAELWEDLAKLHRVLALVERETSIIDLMQPAFEGGTTVRLGHEIPAGEDDLAVVSKEFGGEAGGRVGLLGPIRMDYKRAIRVVEEVGEALDDSIGGS